MTTIAWDGKALAADSRATEDDESAKSNCTKIWRIQSKIAPVKGEILLAGAGDEFAAHLFKEWLEAGGEPNLHARGVTGGEDGEDFDAFIVHKSGTYNANRLCCFIKNLEPQWAHGTGRQAALAAMRCGKSAIDAVRIAAGIDPFTGGRIMSMSLVKETK